MISNKDFVNQGHYLVDWLSDYFNNIEKFPVCPDIQPGDIECKLPDLPPNDAESLDSINDDFNSIILPGITHWQSPHFHAYFPSNNSFPSVLAELLSAGLGVQGMKWLTSPSVTELEQVIMKWLRAMLDLPSEFKGVIMDTASVSTLCAILAAREKATGYTINEKGFGNKTLRVYCSTEAHSSIEKAVRIAGIGSENLVKIPVDNQRMMDTIHLAEAVRKDIETGYIPSCIIGVLGSTSTGAVDPLTEIGKLCNEYKIWFHIDAAYSGNALILPEYRSKIKGIEFADSFVFNPHKWMFTNFDCSAFFVKNPRNLTKTFSLVPPYLQTAQEDEIDYSNWGIQLGRRFRALKLWYVIRSFGVKGLQDIIRKHIGLGAEFEKFVRADDQFEMMTERNLNIICFRLIKSDLPDLNQANKILLDKINKTGKIFLSHTVLDDIYALRFVCGQTNVELKHIKYAWDVITSCI